MTTRQKNLLVLVLVVAPAMAFLFWKGQPGGARPSNRPPVARALDAVPAETFLVATLDVAKLRGSPLLEPLRRLGAGFGKDVSRRCGFEPMDRLDAMAVAVPEEEGSGDFGIAMTGRVSRDELVGCGRMVMQDRGATIATETVGDFTLVQDRAALSQSNPFGKLALRPDGPFLLARGTWLTAMMDAASGKKPRAESNAHHMELRRALEGDKRAVVVTVLLPAKLRDRLKGEMANDGRAMRGILGVEAAGVTLDANPNGRVEIVAELKCETADDCAEVKTLLVAKRDAWQRDIGLRLIGIGALLSGLTIDVRGNALSARTEMPLDDASRLLERLVELRGARTPLPPASPQVPSPRAPDEVLKLGKDGGLASAVSDGGRR